MNNLKIVNLSCSHHSLLFLERLVSEICGTSRLSIGNDSVSYALQMKRLRLKGIVMQRIPDIRPLLFTEVFEVDEQIRMVDELFRERARCSNVPSA